MGGWEHGFIGGMGRNLWGMNTPIPLGFEPLKIILQIHNNNLLLRKYNNTASDTITKLPKFTLTICYPGNTIILQINTYNLIFRKYSNTASDTITKAEECERVHICRDSFHPYPRRIHHFCLCHHSLLGYLAA